MTALETQWSLCGPIASQMSLVDVGQWEGPSDRSSLLVGVCHHIIAGSDAVVHTFDNIIIRDDLNRPSNTE